MLVFSPVAYSNLLHKQQHYVTKAQRVNRAMSVLETQQLSKAWHTDMLGRLSAALTTAFVEQLCLFFLFFYTFNIYSVQH